MSRIKIKNFGPIQEGFLENEGWLDVKKVTVLIGDQGTGKSTVAKLISTFSWLEKTLFKKFVSVEQLNIQVFKSLCKQQELEEYFSENSFLGYEGDAFKFECDLTDNSFSIEACEKGCSRYILPKIQYVSAARNLLTILYGIPTQSNFIDREGGFVNRNIVPFMVKDLSNEYWRALTELAKNGFPLPVKDTSVYHKNHNTFVKTKGKDIQMSSASSGIQSITPLLLVSHFLSEEVKKEILDKVQKISDSVKNQIVLDIAKDNKSLAEKFVQLCNFGKDILTQAEDRKLLSEKLKKYIPSSFMNIVEEPEQNLFPNSQQKLINSLIEYNNSTEGNRLIISTHSPYILSSLNNSILAEEVFEKTGKSIDAYGKDKRVAFADVSAYQLDDGRIRDIKDYETNLINAEAIDSCSDVINSDFDRLLDLMTDNEA